MGDPRPDPAHAGSAARADRSHFYGRGAGGRRPPTSCSSATVAHGAARDDRARAEGAREPRALTPRRRAERAQAVHRHLMRFGDAETLATPVWEAHGTTVSAIGTRLAELWNIGTEPKATPTARWPRRGCSTRAHRSSTSSWSSSTRRPPSAWCGRCSASGPATRAAPSSSSPIPRRPARRSTRGSARTAIRASTDGEERVCYEEVVLGVHGEVAEHLDGIVAPLLIHDLPIHVWWPGDPPFGDAVFDQLVELGDRLIVDSSRFRRPPRRDAAPRRRAAAERRRRPRLAPPRLVAGADGAVLRCATLPPLPAEPVAPHHPLRGAPPPRQASPAAGRSRRRARRGDAR